MDADEQVGFGLVGDACAVDERDKNVRFAGINDFDLRKIGLNLTAEGEGDAERIVLFVAESTEATGVFPAMPGIDDDGFYSIMVGRGRGFFQKTTVKNSKKERQNEHGERLLGVPLPGFSSHCIFKN